MRTLLTSPRISLKDDKPAASAEARAASAALLESVRDLVHERIARRHLGKPVDLRKTAGMAAAGFRVFDAACRAELGRRASEVYRLMLCDIGTGCAVEIDLDRAAPEAVMGKPAEDTLIEWKSMIDKNMAASSADGFWNTPLGLLRHGDDPAKEMALVAFSRTAWDDLEEFARSRLGWEGSDCLPAMLVGRLHHKHRLCVRYDLTHPWTVARIKMWLEPEGDLGAFCHRCVKLQTELAAGAKLLRCSRCWSALYCSGECQKAAWPQHRTACGQETGWAVRIMETTPVQVQEQLQERAAAGQMMAARPSPRPGPQRP